MKPDTPHASGRTAAAALDTIVVRALALALIIINAPAYPPRSPRREFSTSREISRA
jgi:hypothetical protein